MRLEDSIYGWIIFDLEGLILLHMALCDESIDECFDNNLEYAKKEALARVLNEREKIDFNGPFSDFDQTITPFLNDDFDDKKFLQECIFNTTGYYEREGYDKCLKFEWKTKQNPDIIYAITINEYGFHDTIMFKKCYTEFFQQLYHFTYHGEEILKFFYGNDISIIFDYKKGEVNESVGIIDHKRKITKFDVQKMLAIVKNFQYNSPEFRKSNTKKREKNNVD